MPTLLDAAAIPVPAGVQGRSQTPLLTGEATEHRDSISMEYLDACAIYDPPPMLTAVRTRTHKLTYFDGLPTGELYDLRADPGESNNLRNGAHMSTPRRSSCSYWWRG